MADVFLKDSNKQVKETIKVYKKMQKIYTALAFFILCVMLIIAVVVILLTSYAVPSVAEIMNWIAFGIGMLSIICFIVGVIMTIAFLKQRKKK